MFLLLLFIYFILGTVIRDKGYEIIVERKKEEEKRKIIQITTKCEPRDNTEQQNVNQEIRNRCERHKQT